MSDEIEFDDPSSPRQRKLTLSLEAALEMVYRVFTNQEHIFITSVKAFESLFAAGGRINEYGDDPKPDMKLTTRIIDPPEEESVERIFSIAKIEVTTETKQLGKIQIRHFVVTKPEQLADFYDQAARSLVMKKYHEQAVPIIQSLPPNIKDKVESHFYYLGNYVVSRRLSNYANAIRRGIEWHKANPPPSASVN